MGRGHRGGGALPAHTFRGPGGPVPGPVSSTATELIRHIEGLELVGGDHDGKLFEVLGWQRRFIRGVWGRGKGGDAGLSVGRGNGKSALVAGIACAVVDPDGPLHRRRGEVTIVASSFNQARIIFEDAQAFLGAKLLDKNEWRVQDSQNNAIIQHRASGARIRCLGSDPRRLHGIRPLLALCDEPAQWEAAKSDRAFAAIRTSLGKVAGSRLVALGTKPAAKTHWFSTLLATASYAQVHAAAKDASPFHVATWRRANPSLDHLPSLREALQDEADKARMDPAALQSFRALRLNMGVGETMESYLVTLERWEAAEGEAEPSGAPVWGVDLGGSAASSCVAAYWSTTGLLRVLGAFPAEPSLTERGLQDGVGSLYQICADRGELLQLGGEAVDWAELFREARRRFGAPSAIACDRWRVDSLRDAAKAAGVRRCPVVERGQGFRDGAEDVRQFKRALLEHRVTPERSLLLASAVSEARLLIDPAANQKLAKGSEGGRRAVARDDAAAAAILAVAEGRRRAPKRRGGRYLGAA